MINNKNLYIIVATDQNLGIGKEGDMPWNLPSELRHFQKVTTHTTDSAKQNMVIMGRTTWESIPEKHRPLNGRKNIVLTSNSNYKIEHANLAVSLDSAFKFADESVESIFIIGGGQVYAEGIKLPEVDGIYLTKIKKSWDCDTFFPEIPQAFKKTNPLGKGEENGIEFEFLFYERLTS